MAEFMKYLGIIAGLIFVYLVLTSQNTSSIISALSSANVNAITALQGRGTGLTALG